MTDSIAPISGVGSLTNAGSGTAAFHTTTQAVENAAARVLNMPVEELERALSEGHSIQDLALQQGANRGQLIAAIRQAFQSEGGHLDYETSNFLAQRIVNKKGSQDQQQHHHRQQAQH